MANRKRNALEVPGAEDLMNKLKLEVAEELGIHNYDQLDKGDLPARIHGKIGGNMVRKMIEYAEAAMKQDPQAFAAIEATPGVNQQDIESVQQYAGQPGITSAVEGAAEQGQQLH